MADQRTSNAGRTGMDSHCDHTAGESRAVKTLTASGTMNDYGDDVVFLDGASGAVVYTLLSVATLPKGRKITVICKDLTNACSIDAAGSETINGALTHVFKEQYERVTLISDGTEWYIESDDSDIGYRAPAANGALTLALADRTIKVQSTDTSTVAATMTATYAGHRVRVFLDVRSSTGQYTLAANQAGGAGTVTLDAAGEGVDLVYSGTAWEVEQLIGGATFA